MENNKKLTRSTSDRWIAGVCAGIANYFGWDVAIFRLVYLLLTVCRAFCGVVAYIILRICIPEDNGYNNQTRY